VFGAPVSIATALPRLLIVSPMVRSAYSLTVETSFLAKPRASNNRRANLAGLESSVGGVMHQRQIASMQIDVLTRFAVELG
jgi:hypothetical protein